MGLMTLEDTVRVVYSKNMKKIILLVIGFFCMTLPAAAQGYPQWMFEIERVEQELFPAGRPANWYAQRRSKEKYFNTFCFENLMSPDSAFAQDVKNKLGEEEGTRELTTWYTLIRGRREWMQIEAQNGEFFAPYVVAADNPLHLYYMTEETFLRLRALLKLNFDPKSQFAYKVERRGNTVFVWFRDWNTEDRIVRLGFEVKQKVLDICINDCEDYTFE